MHSAKIHTMNKLDQLSTPSLYKTVITLESWKDFARRKINTERNRVPGSKDLASNKWEKYICYYFIEILNFPELEPVMAEKLLIMTSETIGLPKELVATCTLMAKMEAEAMYDLGTPTLTMSEDQSKRQDINRRRSRGSNDKTTKLLLLPNIQTRSFSQVDDPSIKHFKIGYLNFECEKNVLDKLQEITRKAYGDDEKMRDDAIVRLFLRYRPLGPGTGFFWSMDRRVYSHLVQTSGIYDVIEGFASPFNHNLPFGKFCSPFDEDKVFGSLGNFFNYVSKLDKPIRLIANPPYTLEVMNKTAEVCMDYIDRVPGSECILMYPNWEDSKGVIDMKAHPHCTWKVFENKQYTVHDFSIGKPIITPMPLIFFVLSTRRCGSATIDEIADKVSEAYESTINTEGGDISNSDYIPLNVSVGSPTPTCRS